MDIQKIEENQRMILENQKIILLALSKLLTPHCKGRFNDGNEETRTNTWLIQAYHATEEYLEGNPTTEKDEKNVLRFRRP